MNKLALFGGEMAVRGPIAKYNSIGATEAAYVEQCVLGYPLSGYLGGRLRGGHWVQRLEERWADKFSVRHAIAVNSATSGLLAAARSIGLGGTEKFMTTPFSMSATAAAPSLFGAKPKFIDVTSDDFCLDPTLMDDDLNGPEFYRALVVTNLFGGPAKLSQLRSVCDYHNMVMIEDNAQSILATEYGKYAGTVGHIGVFSLNVHKHIQCGEGGIVVTNDDDIAEDIREFINHGEMMRGPRGLNLRMPEVCAAIALAQFDRVEEIVQERCEQASKIRSMFSQFPWIGPPHIRPEVRHVFYTIPFFYAPSAVMPHRDRMVDALIAEGVPLVKGYVEPLQTLGSFGGRAEDTPVANGLHNDYLFQFSNCEWTPTSEQIEQFGDAICKVETAIMNGVLK